MAKCVWALLDEQLTEHVIMNSMPDAKVWLFMLMESTPKCDMAVILTTLWAIWWARRKAIHEEKFQRPLTTFAFIQRFLKDLSLTEVATDGVVRPSAAQRLNQRPISGRWLPPPEDFFKINVHAGVARSGAGGSFAAICRTATGKFLVASTITIAGLCDPTALEALACNEALSLAIDLNISRFYVSSDCMLVIKSLEEKNLCHYSAITREILERK
ncbi:uncharacterized protein LOC104582342 [Brachypodium distachyon]|uniref:uncharacterized protein LOC104582342 n=1 Tax=Brachypodium distachyon TaxID=15368 RepID=UPI00052FF095|nr:uncharacterized protein LOC104582342 [Brachypodium distachyon]|eukprot:XP_010230110.1 uncharacterized protein LOC104582342 [Brachypodium distachyon]